MGAVSLLAMSAEEIPEPKQKSADRTLVVVWIANFVTALGMMSFIPFFPSHLRALGVGEANLSLWTGICVGAAPLAAALMGPIWGALGDRFGRKMMVMRSLLGIFVFVGLMAFATTPGQLLVLRIGQGIFSGFLPPSVTLVTLAFPVGHVGRISGVLQSAMAGGSVLGPLFGTVILQTLPARFMFATPALLSGFAAILVAIFAKEFEAPSPAIGLAKGEPVHRLALGVLRDVFQRIAALATRPGMQLGLGFLFVAQFGIGATNPQLELFVAHVEPTWDVAKVQQGTAYLYSVLAVLGLVAMPAWGRFGDRRGHGLVLLISAACTGVGLILGGMATAFWVLLASRFVLGAFATGLGPAAFGLAAEVTERGEQGAANGAVFSARALAIAIGSMLGGALVTLLGLRGVYYAAGVLLLIAALVAAPKLRRKQSPAQD